MPSVKMTAPNSAAGLEQSGEEEIEVDVQFNIDPADPTVGIMSASLCDVTFHDAATGVELTGIEEAIEATGNADAFYDAVWAKFKAARYEDFNEPDEDA